MKTDSARSVLTSSNRVGRRLPEWLGGIGRRAWGLPAAIFAATAWFLVIYGPASLNVTRVDWIYGSGETDLFQTQLGWEWLRTQPWSFPLGRIADYGYPFGTYVSLTTSLPLVSIPLKLISPILPTEFQWIGPFVLLSTIAQMLFGYLLLGRLTTSVPMRLLGASLLTLSPPLIWRAFIQTQATSHWLILSGIWVLSEEYRGASMRAVWPLVFSAGLLLHPVWVAILGPIWILWILAAIRKGRWRWQLSLEVLLTPCLVFALAYATGYFSVPPSSLQGPGYGYYSWNLNGLFNPMLRESAILPELPAGPAGQYEGNSYLGMGNILLVLLALGLVLTSSARLRIRAVHWTVGAALLAYTLYALSNKAYVGAFPLWSLSVPGWMAPVTGFLRVGGRFIWPVYYALVLAALAIVALHQRHATLILSIAVAAQVADLAPLMAMKRAVTRMTYQSPLDSPFWSTISETIDHIEVLEHLDVVVQGYEPIALYSLQNHMTLNEGYLSRLDAAAVSNGVQEMWGDLYAGRPDDETLYVVWSEDAKSRFLADPPHNIVVCEVDGYLVSISLGNARLESEVPVRQALHLTRGDFCLSN